MAISAELGPRLEKVVDELVGNGRFNSKSEVLREGVRLVEERERKLAYWKAAIEQGIASADAGDLISEDDVFGPVEHALAKEAGR